MTRALRALSVSALLFGSAATLSAQRPVEIGKTSNGTPVMIEGAMRKGTDGIVTATLRVGLQPTIKTANGEMVSMRTVMMFDCAKQTSATKERWFYFDAKATKEARHDKPGIPGYGPAIKGSVADAGLAHVCKASAK